jgi:multisubunit Na+/H+ antiporter MnhF subunit
MPSRNRVVLMAAPGLLVVFALASWLMLRLIPGPRNPMDYMIVGTLSTSIVLLMLFFGLAFRSRNALFK